MSRNCFPATELNFKAEILDSGQVALVDFWAPWCGPCRMLAPVIDELAGDYAGRAIVATLNVDENPKIASRYGIRSIPSLLLFKNGQHVDQMVGAMPKNTIATRLDECIASF